MRVRLAVAVGSNGEWTVYGYKGCDDDEALAGAAEMVEAIHHDVFWVEAELPIPVPGEARATVTRAE